MCSGEPVPGRKNHSAAVCGNYMIVFGGISRYQNLLNDFWILCLCKLFSVIKDYLENWN